MIYVRQKDTSQLSGSWECCGLSTQETDEWKIKHHFLMPNQGNAAATLKGWGQQWVWLDGLNLRLFSWMKQTAMFLYHQLEQEHPFKDSQAEHVCKKKIRKTQTDPIAVSVPVNSKT